MLETHKIIMDKSYKADLLFQFRDPSLIVNKYICGSKTWESMVCGTPMLVYNGTSTAKKVEKEQCGIALYPKDTKFLIKTIKNLMKNKSLLKDMSENGRKAAKSKYNWEIQSRQLLNIYKSIN